MKNPAVASVIAIYFEIKSYFSSKDRVNTLFIADIDECADEIAACGMNERCVNADGGYRCSPACPPGFRPRNNSRFAGEAEEACEDINECSLGLHTCNAWTHYCLNTNGSYACEALTTTTTTSTTTTTTTARISTTDATTPRTFIGSRYNRVQVPGSSLANNRFVNFAKRDTKTCRINMTFNCYLYFRTRIVIGPRNRVD